MHLTIRWKFILSIGLTLLATYLALLSWDFKWQRETATLQAQDQAAERAQALATSLNERLSPAEQRANTLATAVETALQQHPTADAIQTETLLSEIAGQEVSNFSIRVLVESLGPAGQPVTIQVTTLMDNPGGRRGGGLRGGGGGGGGRRGGPAQGGRRGDPGGPPDSPARGGGNRGGESIWRADLQTAWKFLFGDSELPQQGEWLGLLLFAPQGPGGGGGRLELAGDLMARILPQMGIGPSPQCVYATPITLNDKVKGVVIASLRVNDLPQFRLNEPTMNRRGGPEPSTAPSTQPSVLDELAFTIIGADGRLIWPPPPPPPRSDAGPPTGPPPPPASQPSVIELALQRGDEKLAQTIRAALTGPAQVVRVVDMPQLVPHAEAGEAYWVAMAPVATTGWAVTSAIPESQFMGHIVERLYQRAEFLLAGLALLLALIIFITIRISRPIEQMAAAVNQLAAGNLDAQVRDVASGDELGQLAGAFNTMTRQLKQHVAALTEQTKARESVESEMRIARQIQTDLLPRKFPPFPDRKEFELHAVNVPAKRVAGDFYDFFFTPNGLLTIAVADVSGKGMPAALLMAVTRTMIRNLANEGLSPQQIAERANQMLLADLSDSMFVTLFLLQYDPRSGAIVYVNAGHPRPYVFADHDIPKQFGEVTGALLGVHTIGADWAYEQREDQLRPGQTILIYTDGVTEARSPQGIMLRDGGLEQLIGRYGSKSVEAICSGLVDELDKYQGGQPADDVTLVALRRNN